MISDDALPTRDMLVKAGRILTPENLPSGIDVSEVARLAASDAAHLIHRVGKAIQEGLEKIETLEDAGLDPEIAVGAGLHLASEAGKDTVYREAIFEALCKHLDLTCEEGIRCVKRYWSVKSELDT